MCREPHQHPQKDRVAPAALEDLFGSFLFQGGYRLRQVAGSRPSHLATFFTSLAAGGEEFDVTAWCDSHERSKEHLPLRRPVGIDRDCIIVKTRRKALWVGLDVDNARESSGDHVSRALVAG